MEAFTELFHAGAKQRFGSGWVWLVVKDGTLKLETTGNQETPIMVKGGGMPVLGLDVWEHAYYLKYKNERAKYVDAFMKVINWDYCNVLFGAALKG